MSCNLCKAVFPITLEQARLIGGDQPGVQTIEGDVACERCGYNLRTLKVGGKCPECGEVVRGNRADGAGRAQRRAWFMGVSVLALLGVGFVLGQVRTQYPWGRIASELLFGLAAIAFGARSAGRRILRDGFPP